MNKLTKKIILVVMSMLLCLSVVGMVACGGTGNDTGDSNKWTVTFMVDGTQYGTPVKVIKGRRVSKPTDPTLESTDGVKIFTGWYTEETFDNLWDFSTDIVQSDITLYAGYDQIFAYGTELNKGTGACSSTLTWLQSELPADTSVYTVKLTNESGSDTVNGTYSFDATKYLVTFTPSETDIPQGGYYKVEVSDSRYQDKTMTKENVLFGGAGTELNPYLIASADDFAAVNKSNDTTGKYYRLYTDITISSNRDDIKDYTFDGTLDGFGKAIIMSGSNTAAIHKIGQNGVVKSVVMQGAVSSGLNDSIGSIADYNAGKIEKVVVKATVTSTSGTTGSNGLAATLDENGANGTRGIAGGVVGTNLATGIVNGCRIITESSSIGVVKAQIGGGCIVGYNLGKVEYCISEGGFGAWNSVEAGGKSLSNYSYSGGVVGINKGTIEKCSLEGSGKLLAQRSLNDSTVVSGTTNSYLGGIVGYNMEGATVSQCEYSGIRVHGDEYIGGIAGENAGTIIDCIANGVFKTGTSRVSYVGGRQYVGGIAGKISGNGTVTNCISTVNVYAYVENTGYSVAEKASNSVYVSQNPNANSYAYNSAGDLNPACVALTAPVGENNQVITISEEATANVLVAESYLSTVGNVKWAFDTELSTIVRSYEAAPEASVSVELYVSGSLKATVTVFETGAAIDGYPVDGFVFKGWSFTEGGEIDFAMGEDISYYDIVEKYGAAQAKLYGVYEVRQENAGVIVALWMNYADEMDVDKIKSDFEALVNGAYEITWREYEQSKVADFGAAINNAADVDVIIGSGNNINTTGNVSIVNKAAMVAPYSTSRQAALLYNTERAVALFKMVTGLTEETLTVTINYGAADQIVFNANSILGNSQDLPEITAPEGKNFIGWAGAEDATEAVIAATKTSIKYADVKDLAVEGAVSLYPVFETIESDPEQDTTLKVSIWSNWVDETTSNAIKADFTAYLTASGYDVATLTIDFVALSTDGNKVADLGAAVNAAGDYDIIIGCGKNVSTGGGVHVEDKATMNYQGITARYVAILTDNDLAKLLYDYLTDTTLKVSIWSKWVDETTSNGVKDAFVAHLTANGYDVTALTIDFVALSTDGDKVADLGAAVNAAGDYDIVIGCGKNVTTGGGVECIEKSTMNYTGIEARYAANLTGSVLANLLYDFLTVTAA